METITNYKLIERIHKLMDVASRDDTRAKLCGVHILTYRGERHGDYIVIEATDGHRAIRETYKVNIKDLSLESLEQMNDTVILRQQAGAIKSALKEYKNVPMPLDVENNFLQIGYGVKVMLHNNMDYPNMEPILKNVGGPYKIGVDAKYLFELMKVMKESGTHGGVTIEFDMNLSVREEEGSIEQHGYINTPLVVKRDDYEAVLMPRRVYGL